MKLMSHLATIKENRETCIVERDKKVFTINKPFWEVEGRVGCKVNNKAFAWAIVVDIDYKDKSNRSEWIKQNILPKLEEKVKDFDYKVVMSRNGGYHLWIPIYPLSLDLVLYFAKEITKDLEKGQYDLYPSGRRIFLPEDDFEVNLERNTKVLLSKLPMRIKQKARYPICLGFALHPHFYRNGVRHDYCLGIAGVCKKYMGLSEDLSLRYVKRIVEWHEDEEMKDRWETVKTTFRKKDESEVGACSYIRDKVGEFENGIWCSFCKFQQIPEITIPRVELQEDEEKINVKLDKEFFTEEPFKYIVAMDRNSPHIPLGIFFTFMSGVLRDYKYKLPLGAESKFNIYSIVVRPTGTGKSMLTKTIKEAIQSVLEKYRLQGMWWTTASPVSEMGLVKNGLNNGVAFTIFYDEFRKLMRMARSESEWVSSLIDIYLEAYNYHKEHRIWTAKSEIVLKDIALSMLGLTTPEAMREMNSQYLYDGFLNRFLILYTTKNPSRIRGDLYEPLKGWLNEFFNYELVRSDKFIVFNPDVEEYLDKLHWKVNDLIEQSTNAFAPLYRRSVEIVRRLSALISVLRSVGNDKVYVDMSDLKLALNFVRYCLMYHQNMSIVGGSDTKGKRQMQVLKVMRELNKPVTIKDIELKLLERYATNPNPKMIFDTLNGLKKALYVRQDGELWVLTEIGKIDVSYANLFVKNIIRLFETSNGGDFDGEVFGSGNGTFGGDEGGSEGVEEGEGDGDKGERGNLISISNDAEDDGAAGGEQGTERNSDAVSTFGEGVMEMELGYKLDEGVVVLDIETYSENKSTITGVSQDDAVDPRRAKVRLVQIGIDDKVIIFDMFKVDWDLVEVILNQAKVLVGHNIAFDLAVLKQNYGWEGYSDKFIYDTMIVTQLYRAAIEGTVLKASLKDAAKLWLDKDISKEMQTSYWGFDNLSKEQIYYAADDVRITGEIYLASREWIKIGVTEVFKIEMDFLRDVMINLNLQRLRVNKKLSEDVKKLEDEFKKTTQEFNKKYSIQWTSNAQVDKWLKEHISNYMDVVKDYEGDIKIESKGLWDKMVDDKVRTDKVFLLYLLKRDDISDEVKDFCNKLLKLRQLDKRIDILKTKFLSKDFVEPKFRQLEHGVGRVAVSKPNTQNVPREFKSKWMMPSSEDRAIVKCDWGKLHLIIVASLANETNIKKWEEQGVDIHKKLASIIYGVPEDKVTKEQRQVAKGVAYALLYGSGVKTLKSQLIKGGIYVTDEEAQKFINAFYKLYPRIKKWHDKMRKEFYASCKMHAEYLGGDKAIVQTIKKRMILAEDLPAYMNFKVQGSEADLMKLSAVRVNRLLKEKGYNAGIVNIVHDELVVECDKDDVDEVRKIVEEVMINTGKELLNNYPVTAESEVVYFE